MKQMLINAVHREQRRMAVVDEGKLIEYNFRRGVIMGGYSVFYTDTLAFVVTA